MLDARLATRGVGLVRAATPEKPVVGDDTLGRVPMLCVPRSCCGTMCTTASVRQAPAGAFDGVAKDDEYEVSQTSAGLSKQWVVTFLEPAQTTSRRARASLAALRTASGMWRIEVVAPGGVYEPSSVSGGASPQADSYRAGRQASGASVAGAVPAGDMCMSATARVRCGNGVELVGEGRSGMATG